MTSFILLARYPEEVIAESNRISAFNSWGLSILISIVVDYFTFPLTTCKYPFYPVTLPTLTVFKILSDSHIKNMKWDEISVLPWFAFSSTKDAEIFFSCTDQLFAGFPWGCDYSFQWAILWLSLSIFLAFFVYPRYIKYRMRDMALDSFFYVWLSSFPRLFVKETNVFSNVWSLCQRSDDSLCLGVFLSQMSLYQKWYIDLS